MKSSQNEQFIFSGIYASFKNLYLFDLGKYRQITFADVHFLY